MAEIAASVDSASAPTSGEQPSPVNSFSFAGLHEKAMNYGSESSTPASSEPKADVPAQAEPVAAASVAEQAPPQNEVTNVENATGAQLAQLKDTDLVEVMVDGQPVQMPWSDARGGVMRQAKFTKEMQSLATQRTQFETEKGQLTQIQGEREALISLLSNKELLREFAAQKYPDLFAAQTAAGQPTSPAGVVDPDDIATVGQVTAAQKQAEAAIRSMAEQLEQSLAQREAAIAESIETRQATLKLANDINGTIKSLFDSNESLVKLIPNAEQMLRYEVSKLKPRTAEETLDAFKTVFGGWKEQFDSVVQQTNKQAVVTQAKQKLAANNIQPPGGAGVQPQPASFMQTNKHTGKQDVDWKSLRERAMSMFGN